MCKSKKRCVCVVYDADGNEIGYHDLKDFDKFDPKIYEDKMPITVRRYVENLEEVCPLEYTKKGGKL